MAQLPRINAFIKEVRETLRHFLMRHRYIARTKLRGHNGYVFYPYANKPRERPGRIKVYFVDGKVLLHGDKGLDSKVACRYCHQYADTSGPYAGHDPCIKGLPGVRFACCGHGNEQVLPYIQFNDGSHVSWIPDRQPDPRKLRKVAEEHYQYAEQRGYRLPTTTDD